MPAPFTTPVAESIPFDNSTNGFTADEVQAAIEEARDTATGTAARFIATAGFKGNASAKYMEFFQSVPSDSVPFVMAEDGDVKALSVAVKNTTTATFTVYKNGSSVDTLTLTAAKKNKKSGLSISLLALDELSVKITSGSARDIIFNIAIQVII